MAYPTHCCCMTVRTGTKVLAILNVIGSLSGLIGYAVVAVNYKDDMAAYDKFPEVKNLESAFGRVLAYTVICAIGLIVAILCVRGAFTDERLYILPYLVFHAMVLVVLAILFFIMISTVPSSTQRSPSIVERLASIRTASPLDGSQVLGIICSLFVSLCIGCYFFVVVLSFYKHLTNAANKSAIGMVPAAQSLYPGTYVPPRSYSPVLPAPQRFSDSKTSLV
ncbi:uncharacterized protein LOC115326887 [Ixodes scapularis]|uniref:uncharacterized protein LOC115326887 n=1 Tax=Ixodes scapularis TaxID=6945 RepID=UPI0011615CEC|nr:uncharacterized protein LOC115326887 [Ixodes scapularis]